ncbi:uncharacterized protein LOC126840128 isoform X2 [Adelges cooleyi]|uniref:uncharacterized protein LOC126840128 isoform X2 n=1 Tax=Adelges cooleyi TaxID=133065 RepID=UPI00218037C8|nr:uncharacterized protein LOC126840128 isoform X2 [Adelges cooleyi]
MHFTAIHSLLFTLYIGQTASYLQMLENDSVCSISFTSSNLYLIGREEQSAMIIKESRYFHQWNSKQDFNCRFTVTSSLGLGVFAVIQRMSFRRNEQGQCIDYVQFRHTEKTVNLGNFNFKIKTSEPWSNRICGKVNALEIGVDDEFNNGREDANDDKQVVNSFIDNKGLIEVKIHVSNKSLLEDEELNFEIVFTTFQECKFDSGLWKSCGSKTCIYKDFFNDGKLNCPYKSCRDEDGCRSIITLNGNIDRFNTTFGTKILAGTVAGLFTMFVAFIACLWLFRHFGALCCMSYHNNHPHSSEMQPVPNLDTMGMMATAPPSNVVASGTEARTADKDLPPSYESLFPSK